jgi:hypothetical protein
LTFGPAQGQGTNRPTWLLSDDGTSVAEGGHRILGHRSSGLDEHYGFEPPPGRSRTIEEYEMLWRITFDNAAGFAWGTNWVYVIVHRDDLRAGRLDRAVVTGANY